MKLKLTKDWADYKKGESIDIDDQSVIDKGFELGLFEKPKAKEVEPKEQK